MVTDLEEPPLSEPESLALSEVPQAAVANSMAELSAMAIMDFSLVDCIIVSSSLLRRFNGNDQRLSIFIHYSAYIYKKTPAAGQRESS